MASLIDLSWFLAVYFLTLFILGSEGKWTRKTLKSFSQFTILTLPSISASVSSGFFASCEKTQHLKQQKARFSDQSNKLYYSRLW